MLVKRVSLLVTLDFDQITVCRAQKRSVTWCVISKTPYLSKRFYISSSFTRYQNTNNQLKYSGLSFRLFGLIFGPAESIFMGRAFK